MKIKINKSIISNNNKTYFIADIGANHDGSLLRAKKLIKLAALSGANAAKFQHFKAETIVNKDRFDKQKKTAHQAKWKSSVFQVYKKASINNKWNSILEKECKKYKIDFLTSPYDLSYVDLVNKYIPAFKIGSGDITWREILIKIAKKNKPLILATGASNYTDVDKAVQLLRRYNKKIILMQCNTNYTGEEKNFNYINLRVLNLYKKKFKDKIVLGLSDHTPGHATVLGAVTLGARAIEKHFTDSNDRNGPDHKFALNPEDWKNMVVETRRLEKSLGNGLKTVENNENKSFYVQRRGVYLTKKLKKGHILKKEDMVCLRPFVKNSISPFEINKFLGKKIKKNLSKNSILNQKWIS
tara:strand:+ start:842 stop:1906 length:1065 start_codon:yes stop_codon:yes gene_type:complete